MRLTGVRAAAVAAAIVVAALVCIPAQMAALKLGATRASRRIPILFHRFCLRVTGVRVHVVGAPSAERPLLLAANHASWLDIPVLSLPTAVSFVAKAEIAGWPVFGALSKLQRSIFVDRTRRTATGAVSAEIARRLASGDAIVLFAEGTSSDGSRVLPFRSALLGAVKEAIVGAEAVMVVQPVALAYTHRNGLPLGRNGRPHIAWQGDIDLMPHMWAILGDGAIDVTVTFGAPMRVDARTDRKRLARDLEREVRTMMNAKLRGAPAA